MASLEKKIISKEIGPGGYKCTCCNEPPGKGRRQMCRRGRKRTERLALKEAWEEYLDELVQESQDG